MSGWRAIAVVSLGIGVSVLAFNVGALMRQRPRTEYRFIERAFEDTADDDSGARAAYEQYGGACRIQQRQMLCT